MHNTHIHECEIGDGWYLSATNRVRHVYDDGRARSTHHMHEHSVDIRHRQPLLGSKLLCHAWWISGIW